MVLGAQIIHKATTFCACTRSGFENSFAHEVNSFFSSLETDKREERKRNSLLIALSTRKGGIIIEMTALITDLVVGILGGSQLYWQKSS